MTQPHDGHENWVTEFCGCCGEDPSTGIDTIPHFNTLILFTG